MSRPLDRTVAIPMPTGQDLSVLMRLHDRLLLAAKAVYPDNPEIAELEAHGTLRKIIYRVEGETFDSAERSLIRLVGESCS